MTNLNNLKKAIKAIVGAEKWSEVCCHIGDFQKEAKVEFYHKNDVYIVPAKSASEYRLIGNSWGCDTNKMAYITCYSSNIEGSHNDNYISCQELAKETDSARELLGLTA